MTNHRFKFNRVNEITGFFVLASLALVISTVVMSSRVQHWFEHEFSFEVLLPVKGASGLNRGSRVLILGLEAGEVDEIRIGSDGRIKAKVGIREDFARFMRTDSTATIKRSFGVAGDSYLEVVLGSGGPLPARATIPCSESEDLTERMESILDDLRKELVPLARKAAIAIDKAGIALDSTDGALGEFQKLGADLNDPNARLQVLLARIDRLVVGLEGGKGSVGKLLTDTELVDGLQKMIADSDAMVIELKGVLTGVKQGTKDLPEFSGSLAKGVKDMPALVAQTQDLMRELTRLVEGLQRHWFISKYIDKEKPQTLHAEPAREPSTPPAAKSSRSSRVGPKSK